MQIIVYNTLISINSQKKVVVLEKKIYLCEQQNNKLALLQSLLLAKIKNYKLSKYFNIMYTINPWLIGALIICATIIAFAAIYFDHLVEKKSIDANKTDETNKTANSSECRLSKKIIKVHRNYIVGFLGFGVIMLLTARFGGSGKGVFTYLSFASTITSLVLSILAIFVTVHSSSELYKQFNKIESATDEIKNASNQINGMLDVIKEAHRHLRKTSNQISGQLSTSNKISDQLDEMSKDIFKRMDEQKKELIDKMDKKSVENIENNSLNNVVQDSTENRIDKKYFISNISRYGLFSLYACSLSVEKNESFELSEFFKDDDEVYAFGVLMAISALGLLKFRNWPSFKDPLICKESYFNKDELLKEIISRIESLSQEESLPIFKRNIRKVNKINRFFKEKPLNIEYNND